MKLFSKILVILFILLDIVLFFKILLSQGLIQFFNPAGFVAHEERNLLITYVIIMMAIVIPVFIFAYHTAWKYRSGNTKADFTPDPKHSKFSEFIVWALPSIIVLIMSVITWQATHKLDPTKTIASTNKPLVIQVVALQWKWLFIYPEHQIATVNFIQFPVDTPLKFELTADAPMNSFWIPQLGGQMYAMTGMTNSLNLIANKPGDYRGSSAEISGKDFIDMKFTARASSQQEFDAWVAEQQHGTNNLDLTEYKKLAKPSEHNQVKSYVLTDENLYNEVMMQFMPARNATH